MRKRATTAVFSERTRIALTNGQRTRIGERGVFAYLK
jgi:hypothetical protein